MVLSRNDKRKRKEGDLVDLVDPLSGANKRPKVHAQRKFAQGAATIFSPTNASIKEKEKPKSQVYNDVIANKCPNTEDFLTFLCFRGTSILPPTLNYFNLSSKKEKNEQKASNLVSNTVKNVSSSSQTSTPEKSLPSKTTAQKSSIKAKSTSPVKKAPSTVKMANTVIKSKTKFNIPIHSVQSLKKKLQGQRIVKQKLKSKLNPSNIIRTRSRAEQVVIKTLAPRKFPPQTETKRHGLRSGGLLHHDKLLKGLSNKTKLIKSSVKATKKVVMKARDSSQSNSEDEDQQVVVKKNEQKVMRKIAVRRKIEVKRVTRSYREDSTSNISGRPTRKTKEAAAVYMEILGRKLVNSELENEDDNISMESFPELPNAKKVTQTENEIKTNVRLTSRNTAKVTKNEITMRVRRLSRGIIRETKPVMIKNKRQLKLKRYCEIESEDESECSEESGATSKPVTRNSIKDDKGKVEDKAKADHNLRSGTKKVPTVEKKEEIKAKKEVPLIKSSKGESKNSLPVKRKKLMKQKVCHQALKKNKVENKDDEASEEETLGQLLSRMNKKKEEEVKEDTKKEDKNEPAKKDTKEIMEKVSKEKQVTEKDIKESFQEKGKDSVQPDLIEINDYKISDDEESFKGFSRKSITKALSILAPENDDLIVDEDRIVNDDSVESKIKPSSVTIESKSVTSETKKLPNITNMEKCEHETKVYVPNIVNMPQSSNSTWKERLNMSTERIEKWLSESSLAKEANKMEMDNESNFKFEEAEEKKPIPRTHLSISTKIQHLVRPVNVTLSKLGDKSSRNLKVIKPVNIEAKTVVLKQNLLNKNKVKTDSKEEMVNPKTNKITTVMESKTEKMIETKSEATETKIDKCTVKEESHVEKVQEKKVVVQPRKLFQKKIKERKEMTPSANAFSPENESSVYAFESDNEMMPVGTPFRRKNKDGGKGNSNEIILTKQDDKFQDAKNGDNKDTMNVPVEVSNEVKSALSSANKISSNNFELPKTFANVANMQVLPLEKLSTNWSSVNCSSSIAVQVNLDEPTPDSFEQNEEETERQKSNEISTQTDPNNDNDNEEETNGHLFYIPLQAMTRNGSNLVPGQQLIQGVAVKFDTEGPTGPNQRVLLKAKLVTKPPITVARCPPVGTVQPTTRTPPSSVEFSGTSVPSSSTSEPSTSGVPKTAEPVVKHSQTIRDKIIKLPKVMRDKKSAVDLNKGKRMTVKSKGKNAEVNSSNKTTFPNKGSSEEARMVEAPTFHPSEKDFQDPLEYIDKIRSIAEKFGICRVVPPPNFKPECKVSDDMRFTAYNQYIHKMLHRWGPNVKEMMAIRKYLATQSITFTQPPWIGGMEVDLPHLYQTVQSLGGLKEVIEKKKWQKVADGMKIPRSAQDRVTKLDDIYCKYLLPYDTLSPEEREKLFDEVETEWKRKEARALQRQENQSNEDEDDDDDGSDDIEECIVKGRNMPLNAFYRIARNTQRMWFGENQRSGNEVEGASAEEVEAAFWKHVAEKKRHVCVHNASIDSSGRGFGFSVAKNSPFARHPWNLKVLTNNAGSVLRALGPLMGVTVPTLHVGMLFSACCWYRDPHGLPWIEYLHTGAKKIWYGIPDEHNNSFRDALMKMVPRYCKNKTIWLPSDTAMVPPDMLVRNGVSLCHTVQEPGQFIIVFPKAFTSSICTGYVVSESVYFAQSSWLDTAEQVFQDIKESCEPSIFSLEKLLISIINDTRSQLSILNQILPTVKSLWNKEINLRNELEEIGLTSKEKLPPPECGKRGKGKKVIEEDGDYECDTCRANLSLSLVSNNQDDSVYCLAHALQLIKQKKSLLKGCTLMYTYDNAELLELIDKLQERINAKSKKTNQIKK